MTKKYKVTKPFGKYRLGAIVLDDKLYIRRKLDEGGCLERVYSEKELEELKVEAEKAKIKAEKELKAKLKAEKEEKDGNNK